MLSNMTSLRWLCALSALWICISTGSLATEDRNPGIRTRNTQKGLDYGCELAVDMLMANKDKIKLFDVHISVVGSSMVLSNMVIKELPRPNLSLTLLPNDSSPIGRVRADVTELHPIVDANMRISYQSWLFASSREGSITATGRNLEITLEAALDKDDSGRPLPHDLKCRATGDFDIALTGQFRRWSRLFGIVYSTLQSQLKPTIFTQLCENIIRDVNTLIDSQLNNLQMVIELGDGFVFDYRITSPPHITSQFIENSHDGGIYLQQTNFSLPPFEPPVIPEFADQTEKMGYLYITEYVANSGWFATLARGHHQITLHENTTSVPEAENAKRFLRTTCPGSSCLGSVFPRLSWLYPNSSASVDIQVSNSSDQSLIRLRGGRSLTARVELIAEIYIQTERSRDHILTVNATALCGMNLAFGDNRLILHVTEFDLKTDVQRNSLGLLTSFTEMLFDTFIAMISRVVIFPALQMIGAEGLPLINPKIPELKFVNPEVIDHNIPGLLIIGTDLEYTIPDIPATNSSAM